MMVAVEELLQGLDRLVGGGDGGDIEAVIVTGEAAAGIVLLDRHLGAGDAGVLGLLVEPRGRPRMLDHLAEIADLERGQGRRLRHLDHHAAVFFLAWRGGACRVRRGGILSPGRQRCRREEEDDDGKLPEKAAEERGGGLHGMGPNGARKLRYQLVWARLWHVPAGLAQG